MRPCLIAYVASGLRSECEPTASAVGHTPSTLVTADYPEGRVLVAKGDVGAGQLQGAPHARALGNRSNGLVAAGGLCDVAEALNVAVRSFDGRVGTFCVLESPHAPPERLRRCDGSGGS